MDLAAFFVTLVVLLIVGSVAAVVAREAGWWSPALPDWASGRRLRGRLSEPRTTSRRAIVAEPTVAPESAPVPVPAPPLIVPVPSPSDDAPLPPEWRRLRDSLRDALRAGWREELQTVTAARDERLGRLERRLDEERDHLGRRLDDLLRVGRGEQAAVAARSDASLERLRSELLAALTHRDAATAERDERLGSARREERRAEVTAELYGRLARLEAAVAAVTNPILLPGEPFAPPAEFLAESLVWENWKDVGERSFAFADYFNAQRLHLTDPVCTEVASFVAALRGLLTRSVYPNLRPDAAPAELQALRAALDQLAAELPRLRGRLETEFRRSGGERADRTGNAVA